ncbi:hypothetical protein HHI36_012506 [Cryptolaemus montrouzieri]|uniref:Uncharacterized protein n=1 Tax=Cryptolaemus montrouzieri TaxID=559131 RepID=A0ABD2NEH3_9CUCU
MKLCCVTTGLLVVIYVTSINAQLPPRLSIPGAVLLPKELPYRQGRLLAQEPQPQILQRPRRPNPPIRPVIEENEDRSSNFDDEVNKLGISALQSAVRQAEEDVPVRSTPSPIQFRPERPVPVLRQDVRENYPSERPSPRPIARQQEYREPQPVRVPQRQQVQHSRPPPKYTSRPLEDEDEPRRRKPVVQILRKYRTDNADGSITWGFENEDGTFKEETIGVDCIISGKYGYVDPDGVKREYSYESGNPCDQPEEEEDLPPQIQGRKEQLQHQGKKIQYRPIGQ